MSWHAAGVVETFFTAQIAEGLFSLANASFFTASPLSTRGQDNGAHRIPNSGLAFSHT
uniref:Uncharacterized protein n=1 Tax=Pseudomonas aeruginosa TaxID=287 RepID=A0A6C0L187_PSEAI|nr:hypothetical protein [Pseudomonas aeruginosa]